TRSAVRIGSPRPIIFSSRSPASLKDLVLSYLPPREGESEKLGGEPRAQDRPRLESSGTGGSARSRARCEDEGRKQARPHEPRLLRPRECFQESPATTYFLGVTQYHRRQLLNFRVRDGNGCIQPAMVTGPFHFRKERQSTCTSGSELLRSPDSRDRDADSRL